MSIRKDLEGIGYLYQEDERNFVAVATPQESANYGIIYKKASEFINDVFTKEVENGIVEYEGVKELEEAKKSQGWILGYSGKLTQFNIEISDPRSKYEYSKVSLYYTSVSGVKITLRFNVTPHSVSLVILNSKNDMLILDDVIKNIPSLKNKVEKLVTLIVDGSNIRNNVYGTLAASYTYATNGVLLGLSSKDVYFKVCHLYSPVRDIEKLRTLSYLPTLEGSIIDLISKT